jgi:hypothetical protein
MQKLKAPSRGADTHSVVVLIQIQQQTGGGRMPAGPEPG